MSDISERDVRSFWNGSPCGEGLVGGAGADLTEFFRRYDAYRYRTEGHILRCLDELRLKGRDVLEIGVGQGADSEQIIRRGAHWHGLDLTLEAVVRVKTRLRSKGLPFGGVAQGSILAAPYKSSSFDLVYAHGVLHHVPDIVRAQSEIARVLRPGGELVAMVYARRSLNYQLSIRWIRRALLLLLYASGVKVGGLAGRHLENARRRGLWRYLRMENFIHHNTDGPDNPFSRVYDTEDVKRDFPDFTLERAHKEFMHAPPLPVHGLPGASWLGWHLWLHLRVNK